MKLSDKVAIVTGAADGIGLAIAEAFLAEGAAVILADINMPKCQAEAERLAGVHGKALAVRCDVGVSADFDSLVERVCREFGGIDILVNNAAVSIAGKVTEMTEEAWNQVIDTNLTSVFRGTKAVIPYLLRRGGGAIVNLASTQAHVGFDGWTAYAAAKGGIIAMTQQLAKEFAPAKIRINCISPGTIATPMADRLTAGPNGDRILRGWIGMHPLGRLGKPEEVAAAAVFLASEEAGFVTGHDLVVDGGLTKCPRYYER